MVFHNKSQNIRHSLCSVPGNCAMMRLEAETKNPGGNHSDCHPGKNGGITGHGQEHARLCYDRNGWVMGQLPKTDEGYSTTVILPCML